MRIRPYLSSWPRLALIIARRSALPRHPQDAQHRREGFEVGFGLVGDDRQCAALHARVVFPVPGGPQRIIAIKERLPGEQAVMPRTLLGNVWRVAVRWSQHSCASIAAFPGQGYR